MNQIRKPAITMAISCQLMEKSVKKKLIITLNLCVFCA
jgi:hypothetical protein